VHISSQRGSNKSPGSSNIKGSSQINGNSHINGNSQILADSKATQNKTEDKATQNNTEKKAVHQSNTKIEITLVNKTDRKEKKGVELSDQEWLIAEKIARLVWTQVRAVLINYDSMQSLQLTADNIFAFLKNTFNYREFPDCEMFRRGQVQPSRVYSYEEATRLVIHEQIYRTFKPIELGEGNVLSQNEFGDLC
jgi:hypothetical protein